MDLDFDIEEREKEIMIIEVEGMELEIPEELIQERMELIGDSREQIENSLVKKAYAYKKCLISNNIFDKISFNTTFVNYLDSDMRIYRIKEDKI